MTLRKRLTGVLTSLVLAAPALVFSASPAQAATYIWICDDYRSVDYIKAYNNDVGKEYMIGPGECASVNDTNGAARVDVDPAPSPLGRDVDSWKYYNYETGVWSGCVLGENGAANPFGLSKSSTGTKYWNFANEWCLY